MQKSYPQVCPLHVFYDCYNNTRPKVFTEKKLTALFEKTRFRRRMQKNKN